MDSASGWGDIVERSSNLVQNLDWAQSFWQPANPAEDDQSPPLSLVSDNPVGNNPSPPLSPVADNPGENDQSPPLSPASDNSIGNNPSLPLSPVAGDPMEDDQSLPLSPASGNPVKDDQSPVHSLVTADLQTSVAASRTAMIVAIDPDRVIELDKELAATRTALIDVEEDSNTESEEKRADPLPDKPSTKGTCLSAPPSI